MPRPDRCPDCGHSVRNHTGTYCSFCGTTLVPQVPGLHKSEIYVDPTREFLDKVEPGLEKMATVVENDDGETDLSIEEFLRRLGIVASDAISADVHTIYAYDRKTLSAHVRLNLGLAGLDHAVCDAIRSLVHD